MSQLLRCIYSTHSQSIATDSRALSVKVEKLHLFSALNIRCSVVSPIEWFQVAQLHLFSALEDRLQVAGSRCQKVQRSVPTPGHGLCFSMPSAAGQIAVSEELVFVRSVGEIDAQGCALRRRCRKAYRRSQLLSSRNGRYRQLRLLSILQSSNCLYERRDLRIERGHHTCVISRHIRVVGPFLDSNGKAVFRSSQSFAKNRARSSRRAVSPQSAPARRCILCAPSSIGRFAGYGAPLGGSGVLHPRFARFSAAAFVLAMLKFHRRRRRCIGERLLGVLFHAAIMLVFGRRCKRYLEQVILGA